MHDNRDHYHQTWNQQRQRNDCPQSAVLRHLITVGCRLAHCDAAPIGTRPNEDTPLLSFPGDRLKTIG